MSGSALDTSGVVNLREQVPVGVIGLACFAWEDLSPFAQGYTEALFRQLEEDRWCDNAGREPELKPTPGFSDLASEALAMILRDCEVAQGLSVIPFGRLYNSNTAGGLCFWIDRNAPNFHPDFPPLRVYLNDAGKIALSQASGEAS